MNGLGRTFVGARTGRSKLRRPISLTLGALAALLIIGAALLAARGRFSPPTVPRTVQTSEAIPLVTIVEAERRPMRQSLSVGGTLVARHELAIGTERAGGRIESVLVDEGDRVVKGQVLARLDTAILQAQLRRSEAAAEDAKSAAASTAADFKRANGIRGTGAISSEEVDRRRSAAQSAAARLAAARAETGEIETRIAESELRAPVDGMIAIRNAEPGAITVGGGEPMFRLIEDGRVEFDAQVPQDELPTLRPGLAVELRIGESGQDGVITGRVRAIAPTLDARSRLGIVHIALPADVRLRPGAFVEGRILLSAAAVLAMPRSAILSQGGTSFVYVVEGGHARRRIVETGAADGAQVEIRKGLAEGEHVIRVAGAFLHDGAEVREGTGPPPEAEAR